MDLINKNTKYKAIFVFGQTGLRVTIIILSNAEVDWTLACYPIGQ